MELGKNALADLTGIRDRAFGKEDNDLAEFWIWTLRYNIRCAQMGTELTFELLSLDLQTARADDVVFTTKDPKARVQTSPDPSSLQLCWLATAGTQELRRGKNGDIVGSEGFGADFRGIDDEG